MENVGLNHKLEYVITSIVECDTLVKKVRPNLQKLKIKNRQIWLLYISITSMKLLNDIACNFNRYSIQIQIQLNWIHDIQLKRNKLQFDVQCIENMFVTSIRCDYGVEKETIPKKTYFHNHQLLMTIHMGFTWFTYINSNYHCY